MCDSRVVNYDHILVKRLAKGGGLHYQVNVGFREDSKKAWVRDRMTEVPVAAFFLYDQRLADEKRQMPRTVFVLVQRTNVLTHVLGSAIDVCLIRQP